MDYRLERVKILSSSAKAQPLVDHLSEDAKHMYKHAKYFIERSAETLQQEMDAGLVPPVRPYWDGRLQHQRGVRLQLLRRLLDMGLGVLRRRIKPKIGFLQ